MTTSEEWVINTLKIETARGTTEDRLYTNGHMQVGVLVFIGAQVSGTTDPYELTDRDLKSLELIGYNDDTRIEGVWEFSDQENCFDHIMPGTTSVPESQTSHPHGVQSIKFWVTTTKSEAESIGARITQSNGIPYSTAADSDHASRVILTGIAPLRYGMEDVTFEGTHISDDPWGGDIPCTQKNFFVTSNHYEFVKAERHGHVSERIMNRIHGTTGLYINFWDMNEEPELKEDHCAGVGGSLKVNQKRNSFCIGRLLMGPIGFGSPTPYKAKAWFEIFDRYGNSGIFYVDYDYDGNFELPKISVTEPGWWK